MLKIYGSPAIVSQNYEGAQKGIQKRVVIGLVSESAVKGPKVVVGFCRQLETE